jgi:hypothetical protein
VLGEGALSWISSKLPQEGLLSGPLLSLLNAVVLHWDGGRENPC